MIRKRVVLCSASSMFSLQRDEAINLTSKFRGDGGDSWVAALGEFGRSTRGVGGDHRFKTERPDQVAALRECMDMAAHGADRLQAGARNAEQLMVHPLEMLADDVEARIRASDGGCRRPGRRPNSRSASSQAPRAPRALRRRRRRTARRAMCAYRERRGGRRDRNRRRMRPGMRSSARVRKRTAQAQPCPTTTFIRIADKQNDHRCRLSRWTGGQIPDG